MDGFRPGGWASVVRLVALDQTSPGAQFLAAHGSLAGSIRIGDDFEFTEAELDEMLDT